MKRSVRILSTLAFAAVVITILYLAFAFLGNPLSWSVARFNAGSYLKENCADTDFRIVKVGYNLKTGGYYAHIDSPSSADSYFTIYFDGWGQYKYDTYSNIPERFTTLARLDEQYRMLVKSIFPYDQGKFDVSIGFGELRQAGLLEVYPYMDENGNTGHYTLDKDYGLDRSALILDHEYDIRKLGADYGHIILYIHDSELTAERTAELLTDVTLYLVEQDVPFHGIEFHLCEPRNENGQYTGNEITLFDFLYTDVLGDGLIDRVQEHWDIAREHYAIQDGIQTYVSPEFLNKTKFIEK